MSALSQVGPAMTTSSSFALLLVQMGNLDGFAMVSNQAENNAQSCNTQRLDGRRDLRATSTIQLDQMPALASSERPLKDDFWQLVAEVFLEDG